MQPGYLSIESLAAFLDTTPPTVRKLVDKGILPQPVELGTLRRWDVEAVRQAVGCALGVLADTASAPTSSSDAAECLRRAHAKRKGNAGNARRRDG